MPEDLPSLIFQCCLLLKNCRPGLHMIIFGLSGISARSAKRHLLTTSLEPCSWCEEALAGDSVIFIRDETTASFGSQESQQTALNMSSSVYQVIVCILGFLQLLLMLQQTIALYCLLQPGVNNSFLF
ncbi:hypothetical protein HPP92_014884 [Vanilla planifolia]|uniref:Uncharacterized protein n=1 Tax=Vanilla planifolia TaxID=51239 RepID=A0A835QP54_VANPL|nr:hypothetical protein HPP92_014884 [Vanilla planifolia]